MWIDGLSGLQKQAESEAVYSGCSPATSNRFCNYIKNKHSLLSIFAVANRDGFPRLGM